MPLMLHPAFPPTLNSELQRTRCLIRIGPITCRCYPCLWTKLLPMSINHTHPKAFDCSFLCSLQRNEPKKRRQQLGLRLPSRNARTRGRHELAHPGAQTACRPKSACARFARHRCNGFLKHRTSNIKNRCRMCGMTDLLFWGFKPPSFRSRGGRMSAGLGRYAVRAPECASSWRPRNQVPGEGIRRRRTRNAGAPFLGVHLLWRQRRGTEKFWTLDLIF